MASGVTVSNRLAFSALLIVTLVGCSGTPPASAVPGSSSNVPASSQPVASDQPSEPAASSQDLIAADLAAGNIDVGTALEYRAWALFFDPRLPEKYDGAGSIGEDQSLFDEIAASLETLPAEQKQALEGYLKRPTDPTSAFSKAAQGLASVGGDLGGVRVATEDSPHQCEDPMKWWDEEWSPNGSADTGFRVWACGASKTTVQSYLTDVINVGSRLWPLMTFEEPDGMGPAIPDTGAFNSDGNGKIDVYLLDAMAECRQRNGCQQIPGNAVAAAPKDFPLNCARPGFPSNACSAYMLLGKDRLGLPSFPADFAHEFFHILQMSHNGKMQLSWYHEASAVWAEWAFEQASAKPGAHGWFRLFQFGQSLLWYIYGSDIQYRSWVWPLYQALTEGPSNVFETWKALEEAIRQDQTDKVLSEQLSFAEEFRNFAVRNAQPAAYIQGASTGLEDDSWQTKEDLADFPSTPHRVTSQRSQLTMGKDEHRALVDPLDAQYDEYEVTDPRIRQIKIDITELNRAEFADLDVVAQIGGSGSDKWSRFRGNGGKLTLCRDQSEQNVDSLMMVIISNHNFDRQGNGPDENKRLAGSYTIESKDECEPHDLHLGGRITWTAQTSVVSGEVMTQSVSGSADVVIHVVTPFLLLAEREDNSTYNYEYSNNYNCAGSHESGTLESYAGQPDGAEDWDYSIGRLNPGGPIGEDLYLSIGMPDYCGPSMGGNADHSVPFFNGFPDCEPTGDQLIARFDGVSNYVIDCDVYEFNGVSQDFGEVSGHVSGVLRPLDGPHPTPPYY